MNDFDDHRKRVMDGVKSAFMTVKDNPSEYPIEISTILDGFQNPVNVSETQKLPALFYKYGSSRPNDAIIRPVNYAGETMSIIVYAVINAADGDNLITRSAKMHYTAQLVVKQNQNLGNISGSKSRTKKVRLGRVGSYGFRRLSDRGFLEITIEIDHIYPE